MRRSAALALDDIARDLDLVVYALEKTPPDDKAEAETEREALKQEIERLRDRVEEIVRGLDGS